MPVAVLITIQNKAMSFYMNEVETDDACSQNGDYHCLVLMSDGVTAPPREGGNFEAGVDPPHSHFSSLSRLTRRVSIPGSPPARRIRQGR